MLGQLMPWNGKWNIPGVVDPTDLISPHLSPGSSLSMIVEEPVEIIANISREPSVNTEPSVKNQRLDKEIPKLGRYQALRVLKVTGLDQKLSDQHSLIVLFRDAMKDKYKPSVLKNYLGSIRRVFFYVNSQLDEAGTPAQHWSDLLLEYQLVIGYFDK
jgi:hypothetical protein